MRHHVESTKGVVRQWPRVIAESLGFREGEPAREAAGRLPTREQWENSPFAACWIGQATCLLRMDERTILTDPNFSPRAGLKLFGKHVGRARSTALPGDVRELPPVQIVMLSHAHLDHWDKPTLRELAHRHIVAVIPKRTKSLLPRGFGKVIELDWEDQVDFEGLSFAALKPAHYGARYVVDVRRGFNAYVVDGGSRDQGSGIRQQEGMEASKGEQGIEPSSHRGIEWGEGSESAERATGYGGNGKRRVVFAGDTAHTNVFDWLGREAPRVDVAIMGIGTYRGWEHRHATPEQAAEMARRMNARLLMPIHHATFRDPEEPIDEPLERLMKVWERERLVCARVGEMWAEQ